MALRWDKINNRNGDIVHGVHPLHLTPFENLHWGTPGLAGEDDSKNLLVGDTRYTGFAVSLVKHNGFINEDGSLPDRANLGFRPVVLGAYVKGARIVGELSYPPSCMSTSWSTPPFTNIHLDPGGGSLFAKQWRTTWSPKKGGKGKRSEKQPVRLKV